MRRFHRWFGLISGIFLAVIAATGITMQVIDLAGGDDHGGPPPQQVVQQSQTPQASASPATVAAPAPAQNWPGAGPGGEQHGLNFRGLIDHIHDGEYFGNGGRYFSILMGLVLFFFSVSGIWMYAKMFEARVKIGNRKVFW